MKGIALACLPLTLPATRLSDEEGLLQTDEEGLLSLRNQRATLDAGLGFDLMSAATERNVTQMQALVQSLVEESIQGDGVAGMDDDIQQALQIIKGTLLDGIRATLKTEHQQDQASIMSQLTCFDKCRSSRAAADQTCDKHRLAITDLRAQHVQCRGTVKAKYITKVTDCNKLDDWVESFKLRVKLVESCVYGEEYECRTAECGPGQCEPEIDGKFGGWLKQIITDAREGYKTWLSLHTKCKASYHAYIDVDSSCDVTQAAFQSKVCELGQCEYTGCQVEYTRCRADCIKEYHREVKRVECAEKDRKIDWSATEKIECYIGILLASPTDDELKALCHDDMTNCISKWRTTEYDKCNDVCKEIDFESGGYSQHDRRGAQAGESLYDHRRANSEAGTDGMAASTQGSRQLADNEVANDRTAGVNTTHRGHGEAGSKRCTQHLDIDFQPIPCAQPCKDLPELPCTPAFIDAEYGAFLGAQEVAELSEMRHCHQGEHSEKWAYNLCECPTGPNPPLGTYFCPIVGKPSIKEDEYCAAQSEARVEVGTFTTSNSAANPTEFVRRYAFTRPFETTPVVVGLMGAKGGHSANIRFFDVSPRGFSAAVIEPPGYDGPHYDEVVHFMAAAPGTTRMGEMHIEAGFVQTTHTVGKGGNNMWETATFVTPFDEKPAVLAAMQTSNNYALSLGSTPSTSNPWLTTALQEGTTSSIQLALDRSEVDAGSVSSTETIGYIALTTGSGKSGDVSYSVQTGKTGGTRTGWDDVADNTVNTIKFHEPMSNPIAVASKVTRYGNNGGWLRQVRLSDSDILVVVDEDTYSDDEREHIDEEVALAAFSKGFTFPTAINLAPALAINSKDEMLGAGWHWTGCTQSHHGGSSPKNGIWCHSQAQMHLQVPLVGSGRCTATFTNAHPSSVGDNFVRLVHNGHVIKESTCNAHGCTAQTATFDFALGDKLEFWEGFAIIKLGNDWIKCE